VEDQPDVRIPDKMRAAAVALPTWPHDRARGYRRAARERTLCLLVPGAAQCGDRGTVRQVYLHDGWSATMHCLP